MHTHLVDAHNQGVQVQRYIVLVTPSAHSTLLGSGTVGPELNPREKAQLAALSDGGHPSQSVCPPWGDATRPSPSSRGSMNFRLGSRASPCQKRAHVRRRAMLAAGLSSRAPCCWRVERVGHPAHPPPHEPSGLTAFGAPRAAHNLLAHLSILVLTTPQKNCLAAGRVDDHSAGQYLDCRVGMCSGTTCAGLPPQTHLARILPPIAYKEAKVAGETLWIPSLGEPTTPRADASTTEFALQCLGACSAIACPLHQDLLAAGRQDCVYGRQDCDHRH